MTWKFTLIAAAICGSLSVPALAGSVAADPNQVQNIQAVETGDLNLAAPKGRAALDTRLRSAARHVCGVGESRELRAASFANKCFTQAMDSAHDQMTALLEKSGQDVAVLETATR
jgi:UrcA family protein